MKLSPRFSGLLVFCLIAFTALSFAQTTSVTGTVTDPSGAVVPGAQVTLTNRSNGVVRSDVSDATGTFSFPQIAPALYGLKAEKQGFKTTVASDIEILVNTAPKVALQFKEVGSISETVVVNTNTVAVNTTDATLGNAFNSVQVLDLPLSARNVVGLLSLQPGVTTQGNVNGGRFDQSNITLDGVDVNDQDQRGSDSRSAQTFFSVLRMTPDSLSEFRVTTTNPNADQGRSSGAQISLVTKSGTNAWHGSLYEYNRVTALTANNWFNNKAGNYVATDPQVIKNINSVGDEKVPRPNLIRNNYGGSVGGPLKRDKLFVFFNYEGFREAASTSIVQQVPLAALGQGIVKYKNTTGVTDPTCPSGTPASTTCLNLTQIGGYYRAANGVDPGNNPAALALLAGAATRYPSNDTTVGDLYNTAGYRFNTPTPTTQGTAIGKIDYNLNQKHVLFVRANYQQDISVPTSAASRFPDSPVGSVWDHPRGLGAGETWTINSRMVNSFHYGITRDAISTQGDSGATSVAFRFIYQPFNYTRTASRTTPVHNFTDDYTWTHGKHQVQLGANIRLISNTRNAFSASYDSATTNPSGYIASGLSIIQAGADGKGAQIFPNVDPSAAGQNNLEYALAAVVGRYSQYSANLVYDASGKLQPPGTAVLRTFKTQEYETYVQDSWRVKSNLTVNYGVRWSTSTPVYEAQGFEITPTVSLADFLTKRIAGSAIGVPYNTPITVDYAGKANNKPGYYPQDWNNFGPALSFAYQPSFRDGILGKLIGDHKTTFRGGYRMTYDHIGSALAIAFDLNNTLGFTSAKTIPVNTYNMFNKLGPLYTGLTQDVRTLPNLTVAQSISFPQQQPSDGSRRIESSLDSSLTTPYNHGVNFTMGRDLGKGYTLEVAMVGRFARHLLAQRDVMQPNDLTDPKSGVDWYGAMYQLELARNANTPITSVGAIPYFENLFPGIKTSTLNATQVVYKRIARKAVGGGQEYDYTTTQDALDNSGIVPNIFYNPQYGALQAFSTVGRSNFTSLQVSLRKQLSSNFQFDLNYTWGHSDDDASGAQNSAAFGTAFIENALRPQDGYANSNFDVRHVINFNYLYNLPFGNKQRFGSNMNPLLNAVLGGWRTTGIFRYNTGLPGGEPADGGVWATNWEISSYSVRIAPIQSNPSRTGDPNLWGNNTTDITKAYQSFRNSYAGESGDRNTIRYPGFVNFDMGLFKEFPTSFLKEGSKFTLRAEVFNLANTQHFTTVSSSSLGYDPYPGGSTAAGLTPSATFGKFTSIQGNPRLMQFALRFDF